MFGDETLINRFVNRKYTTHFFSENLTKIFSQPSGGKRSGTNDANSGDAETK